MISIIAILAAMLLPALNRAKDSARVAVCINNLKQLGTASEIYLNDNQRWFAPTDYIQPDPLDVYAGPGGVLRSPTGHPYYRALWADYYVGLGYLKSPIRLNMSVSYADVYYGSNSPFFCPELRIAKPWDVSHACIVPNYAYTQCGGYWNGGGWSPSPPQWNNSAFFGPVRATKVRKPAEFVLLGDCGHDVVKNRVKIGIEFFTTGREYTNEVRQPFGTVDWRHRRKPNVLWLDGHASRIPPEVESLESQAAGDYCNNGTRGAQKYYHPYPPANW